MHPIRGSVIPEVSKDDIESVYRSLLRNAAVAFVVGISVALALAAVLAGDTRGITSAAEPNLILYPVFALFLLAALVLTRMGWVRIGGVRRRAVDIRFYRTFSEGEEPEAMRVVTRNFINLFEVPVFFYVGVIISHITHQVTWLLIGLAWAYVILRWLHTAIHLTSNDVPMRLAAYAASGLVLLVMWGTLFVQLLRT